MGMKEMTSNEGMHAIQNDTQGYPYVVERGK